MKKSEFTRQYIIEAAAPIFNSKGYAATSIADILDQTGLAKGCLYGHFESKDQLADTVLNYSFEKVSNAVSQKTEIAITPRDKLISLLEFYENYSVNPIIKGGCPLLNAAVDADDQYTELSKATLKFMNRSILFIANLLQLGKEQGQFYLTLEPVEEARYIFATIEGGIMMSKLANSPAILNSILSKLKNKINLNYTISRKSKKNKHEY